MITAIRCSHNIFAKNVKHLSTVTIVGCGLMGSGISQVAAQNNFNVYLVDLNSDLLSKAKTSIETSLQRVAKKKFADDVAKIKPFVTDIMKNINLSTDTISCVKKSNLVIEAIVENIDVKRKLFEGLDAVAPETCIFASNTSSLIISDIAKATKRQDRFGGLHFFNPVPIMKLVEVIRTPLTSDSTYNYLMNFAHQMGKTAVTSKDTPGFIVNRLLVPYMANAMMMLERGDASAADIDVAMKLGAGYPMGPLELTDYVGLDTSLFIIESFNNSNKMEKIELSPMLRKLVSQGHLGRKSGQGFYKYDTKGNRVEDVKK